MLPKHHPQRKRTRPYYSFSLLTILIVSTILVVAFHRMSVEYQIESVIRDLKSKGHKLELSETEHNLSAWASIASSLTSRSADKVVSILLADRESLTVQMLSHEGNTSHFNLFPHLLKFEYFLPINDELIQQFRPNAKLRSLLFCANDDFTDLGVKEIVSKFPNLEELSVACECTDKHLSRLVELQKLRSLTLEARIDGTIFKSFSRFERLEHLCLQEYLNLDDELAYLPGVCLLKHLEFIRLSGSGHSFFSGRDFPRLEQLEFWESDVDDQTICLLTSIKSIRRLVIMYSKVSSGSIQSLRALPQLESLEIETIPSGDIPAWLNGLSDLRNLTVNNMKLIEDGVLTDMGKRFR